jgi:hypothetical protein
MKIMGNTINTRIALKEKTIEKIVVILKMSETQLYVPSLIFIFAESFFLIFCDDPAKSIS